MSYSATPAPAVTPRAITFLIPVGILVLGLVVMVFLIINGFSRAEAIVEDFDRVAVGDSQTFELEEGGYRVWLEGEGVDDGFEFVEYTIVSAEDGGPITTSPFSTSQTYTLAGHTGAAIDTFDLDGAETVDVEFVSSSSDDPDRVLAIGQDNPLNAMVQGIVLGIGVAVLAFIVALVITIVLFVKRGKSRRAQTRPAQPAPPGGYGYPPQGYPPQQGYPPPPGYPPPQGYPPPAGYPQPQEAPPPSGYPPPG